ncbi:MAG: hypothetical protein WDO24_18635 [Pseudomonadota bacterium]
MFSVQYHPEASPGPRDSHYLFDRFIDLMRMRWTMPALAKRPHQKETVMLGLVPSIHDFPRRLHKGRRGSSGQARA